MDWSHRGAAREGPKHEGVRLLPARRPLVRYCNGMGRRMSWPHHHTSHLALLALDSFLGSRGAGRASGGGAALASIDRIDRSMCPIRSNDPIDEVDGPSGSHGAAAVAGCCVGWRRWRGEAWRAREREKKGARASTHAPAPLFSIDALNHPNTTTNRSIDSKR